MLGHPAILNPVTSELSIDTIVYESYKMNSVLLQFSHIDTT